MKNKVNQAIIVGFLIALSSFCIGYICGTSATYYGEITNVKDDYLEDNLLDDKDCHCHDKRTEQFHNDIPPIMNYHPEEKTNDKHNEITNNSSDKDNSSQKEEVNNNSSIEERDNTR